MQLIGPGVAMYDPASGVREERRIGPAEVLEYFGVGPDKVIDVQALAGNSTDCVPGAPGIGIKTAAQLVTEYGDLDALLARAAEIKQPKRREALTVPENVERIRISKRLVTLVRDVPSRRRSTTSPFQNWTAASSSLSSRRWSSRRSPGGWPRYAASTPPRSSPTPASSGPPAGRGATGEAALAKEQAAAEERVRLPAAASHAPNASTPADLVASRADAARAPVDRSAYATVASAEALMQWIARAPDVGEVVIDVQASSADPLQAEIVGVALAVRARRRPATFPSATGRAPDDLFGGGALLPGQMSEGEAIAILKPLLEGPGVLKIGQNVKFDAQVFARRGVTVAPIDDTMLMSYALDAGATGESHDVDALSARILGHRPTTLADVAGAGRNAVAFSRVSLDKATEFAAEGADATLRVWRALKPRLVAEGVTTVYETLERPLVSVLSRWSGAESDRPGHALAAPGDFGRAMARLEDRSAGSSAAVQPGSPSSSATSCSARWACRGEQDRDRRLVDDGERARRPRRRGPSSSPRASSSGGTGGEAGVRPTPTRCPATSIPINDHLRSYQDAVRYAPHSVFIGNRHPDELNDIAKPWYEHPLQDGKRDGPFGEIMPEDEFYG